MVRGSKQRTRLPQAQSRLDMVVTLGEGKARSGKPLAHGGKAIKQCGAAADDDARVAAQNLRLAGRQVELTASCVNPHVAVAHHHGGIAGEPQPGDVEQRRKALVRDADVDVFKVDRVADVFGGAIQTSVA